MDIFSRSPYSGKYFKGSVWPGDSYFPDMFHPKAGEYWGQMMHSLHKKCNFSGIWLDMNEPANFCNGECTWNDRYESGKKDEYLNSNITLPYIPGGFSDLNYKSLRKIHFYR
jgi:alpha-glucosidase (family GH31 glycosyl hydrolase)